MTNDVVCPVCDGSGVVHEAVAAIYDPVVDDQVLADRDQTLSDSDQTMSDRDESSSEQDQQSADQEQVARTTTWPREAIRPSTTARLWPGLAQRPTGCWLRRCETRMPRRGNSPRSCHYRKSGKLKWWLVGTHTTMKIVILSFVLLKIWKTGKRPRMNFMQVMIGKRARGQLCLL